MTEERTPLGMRRDTAFRDGGEHTTALDRLRLQIELAAAEEATDSHSQADLAEWVEKVAQSGVLRRVPLSDAALELMAHLTQPASITEECLVRLERDRMSIRSAMLANTALEVECRASSPSDLFRDLRERAGISAEQTAALFGVTLSTWSAVEANAQPWYELPSSALPAFAEAISEPVDRLLGLIAVAAKRSLYSGIERRVNLSLGRFDNTQKVVEARRDTLRLAFARVRAENRGAAEFLEGARRAAGLERPGPEISKRLRGPEKV